MREIILTKIEEYFKLTLHNDVLMNLPLVNKYNVLK